MRYISSSENINEVSVVILGTGRHASKTFKTQRRHTIESWKALPKAALTDQTNPALVVAFSGSFSSGTNKGILADRHGPAEAQKSQNTNNNSNK